MISSLILILGIIFMVIFSTLAERKVMSACQRRIGPNHVGFNGLLQPLMDGLKLIIKETIIPTHSYKFLFLFSPFLFFSLSLLNWFILPFNHTLSYTEILGAGVLITITLAELSILGLLFAGYSSNSKYSLLGTLRSVAQMISYSIALSLCFLISMLTLGTVDYFSILYAQTHTPLIFLLFPLFFLFLLASFAELGRPPFDLLEAESELVAGHMTEFSSVMFAFFFLAEYASMLFYGVLIFLFFFGNLSPNPAPFIFFLIWARASLPRIRISEILSLGWKSFLPFLTGFLLFLPSLFLAFDFY